MRKIKYILIVTVSICSLLLYSCTKNISGIDNQNGDAQIELQLSTFAVNGSSDVNAKEEETIIKSAYVFIFNSIGVLENPGQTAVTASVSATNEVINAAKILNAKWTVYEGNKDIYIVANPDADLASRLVAMSVTNGLEKTDLEALITAESAFTTDIAAFATKGMLMTAKVSAVAVAGSSITVPVTVTRRHARIDLMLRKAKDLEGANIVVKDVKYNDQIKKTIVFPATPIWATAFHESKETNTTIVAQQAVAGTWSGTASDYTAVTNFYSFEKAIGETAACFELTISIDGQDKLLPVYICSTAQGENKTGNDSDKPLAIHANHVYKVMGTLTRESIDIALNILDWNDQEVHGDIFGSYFDVSESNIILPVLEDVGTTKTLELSASENIYFIEYEYPEDIKSSNPDILPSGITINGLSSINGSSKTGSVTLTSDSSIDAQDYVYLWFKAGNIKKRIKIDPSRYCFDIEPPMDYPYTGESYNYGVISYKILGWTATMVPWIATEYSIDGGMSWSSAKPIWLTQFTKSAAGSFSNGEYFNATLAMSQGTNEHNQALSNASSVTGIYDLSTKGGTTSINTANCYVINAPGTYSLPLVYGNAIKDGANNPAAYSSISSGNNVLSPFVKHDGSPITSPYIAGVNNAVLLWEDAPYLITNVKVLSGQLIFTINKSNISQGNAVIAVRNASNTILWSWHIWVTDYNLDDSPKSFVNLQGQTYNFMPVNIGWCDALTYPARSVKVRFTQKESGAEKLIDFNQSMAQEPGNSPYYQWGRKDPFVASRLDGSGMLVEKTWYNNNGIAQTNTPPEVANWPASGTSTEGINVIKNGILNPTTFCTNEDMDNYYNNLWSANNTLTVSNDNSVVKTIYDPSPVGYKLPAGNAFTGFTNVLEGGISTINGTWDDVSESWNFVKSGSDEVNVPAVGCRNSSNGLSFGYGEWGFYWTAIPHNQAQGYNMTITSTTSSPTVFNYRSRGLSIRSMEDNIVDRIL